MASSSSYHYPKKETPLRHLLAGKPAVHELAVVQQALADGLEPNTLWEEEDLVVPKPKGGCVVPEYEFDSECWPHYNTPLHRAVCISDYESAELLLRNGADVNLYNSIGQTPLQEAVSNQRHDAVRFLLANGADVNLQTISANVWYKDLQRNLVGFGGITNLQTAISNSDATTVKLLVEAGANLCPDSQQPWSALDLALLAGDRKVTEVLLPQGAKLPLKLPSQHSSSDEADLRNASQHLLFVTQGDTLVPPVELHDAYCHTVWQLKESSGHDARLARVDTLIQDFFQVLKRMAAQEENRAIRKCTACYTFESKAAEIVDEKSQYVLHTTRDHLNQSASRGCPLCGIVADALDQGPSRSRGRNRKTFNDPDSKKSFPISPVLLRPVLHTLPSRTVHIMSMEACCGDLTVDIDMTWLDNEWIQVCGAFRGPDTSTDSPHAMEIAKTWLDTCRNDEGHSLCRQAYQNQGKHDTVPKRLLYIGEPRQQLRIIENRGLQTPYCALSYCWGSEKFTTTTRSNLSQHMNSISLDSLPSVMRDAIHVARTLEYHYLWIDALCIIQDDEQDWAHEAAGMQAVYFNADLTISSLVSGDCQTSFFTPRTVRVGHPVVLDIWQPKRNRLSGKSQVVIPEWLQSDPGLRGPVHTRAWALQEQLLSTRILYFGNGMLHWDCLNDYVMEADPSGGHKRMYNYRYELERQTKAKRAIKAIVSTSRNDSASEVPLASEAFWQWKIQLEEFTRRKLTRSSDRLPAFASISRCLANVAGNQFLCGIWNGDRLLECLCWRVKETSTTAASNATMPSWSWAAVAGEISFDLVDRGGREMLEVIPRIEVLSLQAQAGESLIQMDGSMIVKGKLLRKKPVEFSFFSTKEHITTSLLLQNLLLPNKCVFLDSVFEATEELYAMDILSFPKGPAPEGYGYPAWPGGRGPATVRMILKRMEGKQNVFRRVGVGLVPGLETRRSTEHEEEEKGEEKEMMSPLMWLIRNMSVKDAEITII